MVKKVATRRMMDIEVKNSWKDLRDRFWHQYFTAPKY